MIESVNPGLAVGLVPFNWTDIMRLAVIVPGHKFDNVELAAARYKGLPTPDIHMGIAIVDPLIKVLSR